MQQVHDSWPEIVEDTMIHAFNDCSMKTIPCAATGHMLRDLELYI
jgi:hypothetical protein